MVDLAKQISFLVILMCNFAQVTIDKKKLARGLS